MNIPSDVGCVTAYRHKGGWLALAYGKGDMDFDSREYTSPEPTEGRGDTFEAAVMDALQRRTKEARG